MKYILHVDCNAFFASVEEIINPKLKNRPIVVGGRTKRSVVASANYLARNHGIKSAMPIYMAQKLCRGLVVLNPNFDAYNEYSQKFINYIREKFSNHIEEMSIDECFVDITYLCKNEEHAFEIAKRIQQGIYQELNLPVSIGVSYNKFLAKMASDIKKPLGITAIFNSEQLKKYLWKQPIENMFLIGQSSAKTLRQFGIETIGDLAIEENKEILKKVLNKNWINHYYHANGFGSDQLDYSLNVPKSISSSATFLNDTNNYDEIVGMIKHLSYDLISRLNYYELKAKTFSVYIKYPNFKTTMKNITLDNYYYLYKDVVNIFIDLYLKHFVDQTIRLVGVGLSKLTSREKTIIEVEVKNENSNDELIKLKNKINEQLNLDLVDIANRKLK